MYYELAGETRYKLSKKCPVCDALAFLDGSITPVAISMAVCKICGKFRFDDSAEYFVKTARDNSDQRLYRLSHFLRTTSERAKGIRDNSLFPVYSREDFQTALERPDPSVKQKLDALLIHLSSLSSFPGDRREFDIFNDYSLVCAKGPAEVEFYLKSLHEQGFLAAPPMKTQFGSTFSLTALGWNDLERISRDGGESSNAFVAMWFDPSRRPFFDSLNRAITDAGYFPVRIDLVEHVNRIDDEIISQIRQSKFLVADLTGQRNGVYFEAGFMLALGRPVIWVCQKDQLDQVHFDTRQYNTIDYLDTEDLRKRVQFRIEAILGRGPRAAS